MSVLWPCFLGLQLWQECGWLRAGKWTEDGGIQGDVYLGRQTSCSKQSRSGPLLHSSLLIPFSVQRGCGNNPSPRKSLQVSSSPSVVLESSCSLGEHHIECLWLKLWDHPSQELDLGSVTPPVSLAGLWGCCQRQEEGLWLWLQTIALPCTVFLRLSLHLCIRNLSKIGLKGWPISSVG